MPGPDGEQPLDTPRFEPLRPASRARVVGAVFLGPILWLLALIFAAVVLDDGRVIALAFAIAGASFVIALFVLSWVYVARRRQEKRFADGR